jgi:TolA-binding protein
MDINLLVQRLQHGESYVVHNALGDPYQENRPPTSLNIKAAQVIIQLDAQLQQAHGVIQNLQRQLTELAQQHELLQKSNAVTEPSPTN